MHTFKGQSCTIFHDTGLTGSLLIVDKDGTEITVNTEDLVDFVGEEIRSKLISKIEQMSIEELLKINK